MSIFKDLFAKYTKKAEPVANTEPVANAVPDVLTTDAAGVEDSDLVKGVTKAMKPPVEGEEPVNDDPTIGETISDGAKSVVDGIGGVIKGAVDAIKNIKPDPTPAEDDPDASGEGSQRRKSWINDAFRTK